MRRLWWVLGVLGLVAGAVAQGGFGGGGFGGGQGGFGGGGQGQGQGGAAQGQGRDGSDANLRGPFPYLNQAETTSILTPGEYVEWTLDLKQSQVVIAEARSDAFDPALEIVEGEKVLTDNDDRYPGDQRPLVLWTCPKDGKYLLRIRSFRGRAGGQVFSRHVVLDCRQVTVGSNDLGRPERAPMLLKIALKAGDVVHPATAYENNRSHPIGAVAITSMGLPCPNLARGISDSITNVLCAPIDDDYYMYVDPSTSGAYNRPSWTILIEKHAIVPIKSWPKESIQRGVFAAIWSVQLKKGDFVKLDAGGGRFGPMLHLGLEPDLSEYDPKNHPYAPKPAKVPVAMTSRVAVIGEGNSAHGVIALQDCTLWVTRATTDVRSDHVLTVTPGSNVIEGNMAKGRLALNSVQHWEFQAKAGDVVKLTTTISGFASEVAVTSPSLHRVSTTETFGETDRAETVFVASQTGRYLISVSCQGHGGTGEYSISRVVIPPEVFDPTTGAEGRLLDGEVKVYQVTFKPGPLKLLKVMGDTGLHFASMTGGGVNLTSFTLGQSRYYHGIFTEPTSLLVVLRGKGATFTLSFVDPP